MPSGGRRGSKQQLKKPREQSPKWFYIRDILQERLRGGQVEYLVDWEDDRETGERYPPSWAPSKDVTSKAIFDWKKKTQNVVRRPDHSTVSKENEPESGQVEGAEKEDAGPHNPLEDSFDSSQPVRPPCRRKIIEHHRCRGHSDESQLEDLEDQPSPFIRHCSEPPSSVSSSSEIDTDAASDIFPNASSNFFIGIPSKVDFDSSEYVSVSASQDSASLGSQSQSVSAQEAEDSQVILTDDLSWRTIPDSQDYSAFDSQDSHLAVPVAHPVGSQGEIGSGLEISDSQKLSSLGTSLSKTTEYQSFFDAPNYQFIVQQSPSQPGQPEFSQYNEKDLDYSDRIFSTQDTPIENQKIVTSGITSNISSQRPLIPEPEASEGQRSASQESAILDAQAAAQLAQEQESLPAYLSNTAIPSHQVDCIQGENTAEHLSHHSTNLGNLRHTPPVGTPVFLTQPNFNFTPYSSLPATLQDEGIISSLSSGLQASQVAFQTGTVSQALITVSDSQSNSNNSQYAQRVHTLLNTEESQVGSASSIAEEEFVPDSVRRLPQVRDFSIASLESTSNVSTGRGTSTKSSKRLFETSQHNRRGDSLEEGDQTCVGRRSLPPTTDEAAAEARFNRQSSLPLTMASTSGEPLSAVEELLRMQDAVLNSDPEHSSYPNPSENVGQLSGDGELVAGPIDGQDFSASAENPPIHINSQPPMPTDWQMTEATTSSTDLPVLSSAPVNRVLEAPVNEEPQTASMGDIFPGSLMPPGPAEQLPMTISPSDISRSIEPDEGLASLHQQDEQPLNILITEDNTTGKSTASSPDIEDQYRSGPPTLTDQNEYLVTLSFPANIRPLYASTMAVYRHEIEKFNRDYRSGEGLPDQSLVDAIGRLFDQLRDICDLPATLDDTSIKALSATDLKKHAMGTNSKYFFVGRFLERLQTSYKKVLIVVRDISIMGYLEAVIGTGEMAYSLKGLHELEGRDEHSLHIVLLHTEENLVDDLSDFDIVIGFDNGIMRTDILTRWAQMNGRKPMLIRLMTTYSIEHLDLMLPAHLDELERKNALLIAMFQSRSLIANDEQGEMIDGLTAHFANQAIDPEPNFGWEPEPIPAAVLDVYSNSQNPSLMPPTAEELSSRKRKADDGPQESTKRLRLSLSPGQAVGSIDDTVHGHLNPNPAHLQIRTTQDHLDSLTTKVSELEYQLEEKTALELNLRKHITNLSKRVKSHDKTINIIQEKHMAALRERSQFEAERDESKQNEEKAWDSSRSWEAKAQALEEELKKKTALLEEALVNAGTVASDVYKQKTEELEKSQAKIADLEKKLKSRDSELSYARDVYQTADQANIELTRKNRQLNEQVDEFRKQAAGSLAEVQNTNAGEQVREMQRQIAETQAISRDREKELSRVEKELRTLKNGRRETRQQSVPRSPRLGMMSPRTARAAGGSASRGTSPVPFESSGSTPVPGMQFLPSNHRFNHLRE
ncbi:endosomal cargo receptor [Colletotrichum truncatum]|uniref:Endosomal cargo receptor n=1 Tax=Colletotrichum truncatum TaxID=5467 RepID=A0ACC3ZIS9_COLTU|nr:endosomal cargo receptor [Colletotrichum truncatum]KAF6785601.1 endosomal cargo receptor [Colletotrichum truncatum]